LAKLPSRGASASGAAAPASEGSWRSSTPQLGGRLCRQTALSTKETVLIIDDDADLRESLQEVLQDAGYATALAADGRSALTYLRAHTVPGVILLDWNMMPMTGAQLVTEVGRDPSLANIPLVLMTAEVETPLEVRDKKLAAVLTKPVHLDQLLAVIGRCCRL
jgi:CheY-like chemotaxis protein